MLNLPYDFSRPLNQSFDGNTITVFSGKKIRENIKKFSTENSATEYMVLLSTFFILLNKYSGQDDIIVGTPVVNRTDIRTEDMLGMFVNTLPIRIHLSSDMTYLNCLSTVKKKCLLAYENQEYPLEDMVEKVDIERDLSHNPIFDVMFSFQDTNNQISTVSVLEAISLNRKESKISKFDITLTVENVRDEYAFYFEYCTKLFEKESIHRFAFHYLQLIKDIISHSQKTIDALSMISEEERYEIVHAYNNKTGVFPNRNLIDLFEEQVEKTPNVFCVEYEGHKMTYSEVNRKANEIACELLKYGAIANDFIGLYAERSIEMIIGLIGILKSGAAYLPLDSVYPEERVEEILKDSAPKAILTYGVNYNGNINCIELSQLGDGKDIKIQRKSEPEDSLYVIYTSGTTGVSKGVVVKNNSFVNMVYWYINEFALNQKDNIMLLASIGFDLAQKNIFAPLLLGGCLYVYNQWNYDSAAISDAISKNSISVVNCAPSVIYPVIYFNKENSYEKLRSLRYLFLGGETIKKSVLQPFIENENCSAELVNTYRPTECTDIATSYRCTMEDFKDDRMLSIGQPIYNVQNYVLDKNNQLCGIGVRGELCIAGMGVSKGYWNRDDLNKQKFIDNPFGEGKIYKTGDIVRWKENGNIDFIGREDGQVKIRGFRIELQEISTRIKKQAGILDVAVVIRVDSSGEQNIFAYFVADKQIEIDQLRLKLKEELPLYMIPSYIIQLDYLPVTQNGKLNMRELPEVRAVERKTLDSPKSDSERKLCELFAQILNLESVGVMDNFFSIGGHSLKAARLINLIEREFGVRLSLKMVFQHAVVKELAAILNEYSDECSEMLPKAEEKTYYDISSTQKRTYLSYKIDENNTSYNSPYCFILKGDVDVKRVMHTIQKIIERHEILRTSFEVVDGRLVQVIKNDVCVNICYEKNNDIEQDTAIKYFIQSFDLTKPPLLRIKVIGRNDDYLMLWDIHHIVSDAISMGILIQEFNLIYNGRELPMLRCQYKDYSEWILSRDLSSQKEYWLNIFADKIPILNMPLDYTRGHKASFKGNVLLCSLDKGLSEKIKNLAQNLNVTEYMIFLSSFMILFGKYSRQEDLVIGSPISGRTHRETESMLGMFVNTLALRGKPKKEKTYSQFLKEIKETCLKAYDNQEYPFEELVDALDVQRDISRNPLFDVILTMQNVDKIEFKMDGVICEAVPVKESTAKFDISIDITENDSMYELVIEYAQELFTVETIELLKEHYTALLEQLVVTPEIKIGKIQLISEKERKKILQEFNDTFIDFDHNKFIMDYFEEQVERTPNKVAIIFDTDTITYRELNNVVNTVARLLIEEGVGPNVFVALLMERSIEMVIGMLAILKSGAAYVPLDIRYPAERIEYMLKDCNPKMVLFNHDVDIALYSYRTLDLRNCRTWLGDTENISRRCQMSDLAYCIYTSGTTGKPKGTLIEHKGFYNLMLAYTKIYDLTNQDVVLQVANYVFDQSVWDIFNILIVGGTLSLISFFDVRNPKEIARVCNKNHVTIGSFTPAMLAELDPADFETIRIIDSSGESANVDVLNRWIGKCKVINTYGPTEVTVNSSSYVFDGELRRPVPIGKPIANYQMYILEDNELCGIGIYGELCISGIGVARGYLNDEELTRDRFVDNPFGYGKMYRTGDLAKWFPDGNIEFLGRIDEQVKVR